MNRLKENLKNIDFGQKKSHFTLSWVQKEFSFKIQNHHFYPLLNACHQVQFQKNLMHRLEEKFKNIDKGPKNDSFPLF